MNFYRGETFQIKYLKRIEQKTRRNELGEINRAGTKTDRINQEMDSEVASIDSGPSFPLLV